MRAKKILTSILISLGYFGFCFMSVFASEKKNPQIIVVNACVDDKEFFPFAMFKGKNYSGIKFDLVNLAKKKLDINSAGKFVWEFKIHTMPWKRCMSETKKGDQDLLVLASYTPERAEFANYPQGAETETIPCTSPKNVICDGYSIVVMKDDPYGDFNKDVKSIPYPVRVTHGYSIQKELENEGINIEVLKDNEKNVMKLIQDKKGSAILSKSNAIYFAEMNKKTMGHIRILNTPYKVKSSYFPISKKSHLSPEQQSLIWDVFASIGQDKKQMSVLYEKYFSKKQMQEDGL